MTIGPYQCSEQTKDVSTELYDENGQLMTYGQILEVMNGPNFDSHGLLAKWIGGDRKMTIDKHTAVHVATLMEVVSDLDEAGEYTAADVIRWLVWWKELLDQRAARFGKEILSLQQAANTQEIT